jgi:hypothetical protein
LACSALLRALSPQPTREQSPAAVTDARLGGRGDRLGRYLGGSILLERGESGFKDLQQEPTVRCGLWDAAHSDRRRGLLKRRTSHHHHQHHRYLPYFRSGRHGDPGSAPYSTSPPSAVRYAFLRLSFPRRFAINKLLFLLSTYLSPRTTALSTIKMRSWPLPPRRPRPCPYSAEPCHAMPC